MKGLGQTMDIATLRGVMTAILLVTFVGICVWAWSSRRKDRFDAAAQLPLEEDAALARHSRNS